MAALAVALGLWGARQTPATAPCALTPSKCGPVGLYGIVPDLTPGGDDFARVEQHLRIYSRAPSSVLLLACTPRVVGSSRWDTNCVFVFDAGFGLSDRDHVLVSLDAASVRVVRYLY